MTDQTIARTILAQLGGNRFLAMTGAKNIVNLGNGLQMKLPSGARNEKGAVNLVRVTLDPSDTYRVSGFHMRGINAAGRGEQTGIYADKLRETFEAMTGLRCTL